MKFHTDGRPGTREIVAALDGFRHCRACRSNGRLCSPAMNRAARPSRGPTSVSCSGKIRCATRWTAFNLHICPAHVVRVHMDNVAQMINVSQAMTLPDADQAILTPTCQAFRMYVQYQDANARPVRPVAVLAIEEAAPCYCPIPAPRRLVRRRFGPLRLPFFARAGAARLTLPCAKTSTFGILLG